MESEIASEIGMDDGKMPSGVRIGWMHGLHAAVKTQDEIVEIEPQSQAIRCGYLLVERRKAELPAWLVRITSQCPDIAGIYKNSPVKFPNKMCPELKIHVKFDVASLIDKVYPSVSAKERTGPQLSDAPSAYAVGASAEVTLLVRQNGGIAVWISETQSEMQSQ